MFSGLSTNSSRSGHTHLWTNSPHTDVAHVAPAKIGAKYSANMRCWPNVGSLLAHRLRRWPNNKPALGQRLMFAGIYISLNYSCIFIVFRSDMSNINSRIRRKLNVFIMSPPLKKWGHAGLPLSAQFVRSILCLCIRSYSKGGQIRDNDYRPSTIVCGVWSKIKVFGIQSVNSQAIFMKF